MTTLSKALTILAIILAVGIGLVVWKTKVGGHGRRGGSSTKLTKTDMQNLLPFVVGQGNPMALRQLADKPEIKEKLVDSIKEFFAVASQARKDGLADEKQNKFILDYIRTQIVAVNYDREKNKGKEAAAPFSTISKEDTDAFYQKPANEKLFNEWIAVIKEKGKENNPDAPEPTPEQLEQLKGHYAKIKISENEAEEKGAQFGEEFEQKTDLQIRFQQAAFLNEIYAEKVLTDKIKATDEEVAQYIGAHPELDPKTKRAKAEEILQRAKSGEDFAKLADELSEDPGTKGKGGLYSGVTKGRMMPEFEQAALALEPGKVADNLVETEYGYHIIKLDKKGTTKGVDGKPEESYDARHILILTRYADPKNPRSQPMTFEEKAKADLLEEKEKKALDEIKAKNPIEVEEFEIPKPSDEEIQQMMMQQQQRQMPISPNDLEDERSTATPQKAQPKRKK